MRKYVGYTLAAFLGALLAIGVFEITGKSVKKENSASIQQESIPVHLTRQPVVNDEGCCNDFTEAASKTIDDVVHIKTEFEEQVSPFGNFFDWRYFFGNPPKTEEEPVIAEGSGVILSPDGYIVTNNHVIEKAKTIEVILNNNKSYKAKVIGADPSTDLALLKVDATDLPYITYGNSADLKVGQWVLAVGNPFNLTSTVTAGIVSATARNINILSSPDGNSPIESFIQTDAAVNRGNSGGALVNTQGQLVGIISAIASGTGYYAGYSFAIPVNIVKKVVSDLREYGVVQRALMGVQIRDIDNKLADKEGITDMNGVYVAGVTENGAAKAAGLKEGDIIKAINKTPVNNTSELLGIIGTERPGDKVSVTVDRDNKEKTFELTLRNVNGTTGIVKKEEINTVTMLGASFAPITDARKKDLGISHGVMVTAIQDGKLMDAEIKQGFIITKIDKKDIDSVNDLEDALNHASGGILIEGIYPNGIKAYYGIGL